MIFHRSNGLLHFVDPRPRQDAPQSIPTQSLLSKEIREKVFMILLICLDHMSCNGLLKPTATAQYVLQVSSHICVSKAVSQACLDVVNIALQVWFFLFNQCQHRADANAPDSAGLQER